MPERLVYHPDDYRRAGDPDDTASIQRCVAAVGAAGGVIQFGPRIYTVDRAPRTDMGGNSIIGLALGEYDATRPLVFQGVTPNPAKQGTVISTSRTGDAYSPAHGPPSVIGGATRESSHSQGQPVLYCGPVVFRDLSFVVPDDPSIAVIDALTFGGLVLDRVQVGTVSANTPCTHAHAFGYRLPWSWDFGMVEIRLSSVEGMYAGFVITTTDHLMALAPLAYQCHAAYCFEDDSAPQHAHATGPGYLMAEHCHYAMAGWDPSTGAGSLARSHPFYINDWILDIEEWASPFNPHATLLDANDVLHGRMTVHRLCAFGAATDPGVVTGGANLSLRMTAQGFYTSARGFETAGLSPSGAAFAAKPGPGGFGSAGRALEVFAKPQDTQPTFRIMGAGGKLSWGPGGRRRPDVSLRRAAAHRLQTTDQLQALDGLATKVKAGAPSDSDFRAAPPVGTLVVDTSAGLLWVRLEGGIWKSTPLS